MASNDSLRPWKQEYQLLCSIDSMTGEMKSLSPFIIPPDIELPPPANAVALDSITRVISSHGDYEDTRQFRSKFMGAFMADWLGVRSQASLSLLDQVHVNSQDLFVYYAVQFRKSCTIIPNERLLQLQLTPEAQAALKAGTFRDKYGDMVVVGYSEGGEAEAAMRVTKFAESKRNAIKALLTGIAQYAVNAMPFKVGVAKESQDDESQALLSSEITIISKRVGVADMNNCRTPTDWSQLIQILERTAQDQGSKINAVCYKFEWMNQVGMDALGFRRDIAERRIVTMQQQFTKMRFVRNSVESLLARYAALDHRKLKPQLQRKVEELVVQLHAIQQQAIAGERDYAKYTDMSAVAHMPQPDAARLSLLGDKVLQQYNRIDEDVRQTVVEVQELEFGKGVQEVDVNGHSSTADEGPSNGSKRDPTLRQFKLHVYNLQAKKLKPANSLVVWTKCDPYIQVLCGDRDDNEVYLTRTQNFVLSGNAHWKEEFTFDLKSDNPILTVRVVDEDRTRDNLIGQAEFDLDKDIFKVKRHGRTYENWYPIHRETPQGDKKETGSIYLTLRLSLRDLDHTKPKGAMDIADLESDVGGQGANLMYSTVQQVGSLNLRK